VPLDAQTVVALNYRRHLTRFMKMRSLLFGVCLALWAGASLPGAADAASPFHVLVYSKTLLYRHESITNGIAAIRQLGQEHGFTVDATEDSGAFTKANLAKYQAVVFLSVTGEVLDQSQKIAFQDYILNGGGLAAIHGAIFGPQACDEKWSWYGEMFCCTFTNHSSILPATVLIEDANNPSTKSLPSQWQWTDEWYNYTGTPRGCAHVLTRVDESTYSGGTVGKDHPISWCRQMGQGRMWYTAQGHKPEAFNDPLFRQHLLGGILLAAGQETGDFSPNTKPTGRMEWKRDEGSLALVQDGDVVWKFNFGKDQSKPSFHPVRIPDGPVVTGFRPKDHSWHRGLWFSWKYINGLNYWEEDPKTGLSEGRTEWQNADIEAHPDFSARIVMDLNYRPPGGQPVLTEHRVMEISAPDCIRTYRMDWAMTLTAATNVVLDRTPLPGEPNGQAWGGYAGLSARFSSDLREAQAISDKNQIECRWPLSRAGFGHGFFGRNRRQ